MNIEKIKRDHTPKSFQKLFPDVAFITDATYLDIQKCSIFNIQKPTYCSYKGKNLVKELPLVAPDGTMIETFGLFFSDGKHNDQRLWDTVWSENWGNIQQYLDPNTVKGIADRGFSRCQSSMQLLVPDSIQKGNTQLTTEEQTGMKMDVCRDSHCFGFCCSEQENSHTTEVLSNASSDVARKNSRFLAIAFQTNDFHLSTKFFVIFSAS